MFKILLFTFFALNCFAANSLLCRAALRDGLVDPGSFTLIRIFSGALALSALVHLRGHKITTKAGSWFSALSLATYALFFSVAYVRIDAGVGALILFASVQVTMVGWSFLRKRSPTPLEWCGLLLALIGLTWLTLPGKTAPDSTGAAFMAIAGTAWGIYSLRGTQNSHPLVSTAMNFAMATPLVLGIFLTLLSEHNVSRHGALLAVLSGAVTSGLGYSAWYLVLPKLGSIHAAALQLSVPVIALFFASSFLGETLTQRTFATGTIIIFGVALCLFNPARLPVRDRDHAKRLDPNARP